MARPEPGSLAHRRRRGGGGDDGGAGLRRTGRPSDGGDRPLAIGGFAHQVISVLLNTLSADVFAKGDIAKANGLVGMAGWTGGLLFSLAIGQLADKVGFAPLFACLRRLRSARRHLAVRDAPPSRREGGLSMRKATLAQPPVFALAEGEGPRVTLRADTGAVAHVFVLEEDVIRVLLLADGAPTSPPSWAIAPGQTDIAEPGRDRMAVSGFAAPAFALEEQAGVLVLATSACAWRSRSRASSAAGRKRRPTAGA
ncbi:hypothetical protein ACRAWD_29985 [Caulobacter segnis]